MGPKLVVALLLIVGGVIATTFYFTQTQVDRYNGPIALCIDCISGYIGGGCTYTDKNTGETIQPKGCFAYDTTKSKHTCSEESKKAEFCIEIYQPVCGSDAKTYPNSCFACINQNVAFYIDGECSDVIEIQ